jgi:hypothetical protein
MSQAYNFTRGILERGSNERDNNNTNDVHHCLHEQSRGKIINIFYSEHALSETFVGIISI